MGLHPEYVARLQELRSEMQRLVRKLDSILDDGTQGTAIEKACLKCEGKGVVACFDVEADGYRSVPCVCPKGLPFRQAAHVQRIKSGRDRATGRDE